MTSDKTNTTPGMYCLVYQSKAKPIFGLLQIQEMLEKARKFNQEHEITGCLLFYHGDFIQYLEGNRTTLLQLFDRIQNDRRHEFVTLLSHEEITEREFEEWDMAYEDLLGHNYQLQYLELLVSSFIDENDFTLAPNPTSRKFWRATRLLLQGKWKKRELL